MDLSKCSGAVRVRLVPKDAKLISHKTLYLDSDCGILPGVYSEFWCVPNRHYFHQMTNHVADQDIVYWDEEDGDEDVGNVRSQLHDLYPSPDETTRIVELGEYNLNSRYEGDDLQTGEPRLQTEFTSKVVVGISVLPFINASKFDYHIRRETVAAIVERVGSCLVNYRVVNIYLENPNKPSLTGIESLVGKGVDLDHDIIRLEHNPELWAKLTEDKKTTVVEDKKPNPNLGRTSSRTLMSMLYGLQGSIASALRYEAGLYESGFNYKGYTYSTPGYIAAACNRLFNIVPNIVGGAKILRKREDVRRDIRALYAVRKNLLRTHCCNWEQKDRLVKTIIREHRAIARMATAEKKEIAKQEKREKRAEARLKKRKKVKKQQKLSRKPVKSVAVTPALSRQQAA